MGPMGQMGPGGPMMGGGPAVTVAAPDPLSIALLVLLIGLVAFSLWWRVGRPVAPRGAPRDLLRERYARGEVNARQYRDALVGVLKDRYVRGEIELDEYEEKVARLVGDERRGAPPDTPLATDARRSTGDERVSEQ